MPKLVRVTRLEAGGLLVELGQRRVALDARTPVAADLFFYSHAHTDHLGMPAPGGLVLASAETVKLARLQGVALNGAREEGRLYRTGHMLGSTGILLDDLLYYTGDIAGRPRGFMPSAKPVPCRILIVEATYGRPRYRFPALTWIMDRTNELIDAAFSQGLPVLLLGYPLGKSQILSYFFSVWEPHLYISDRVLRFNRAYRALGVELPEAPSLEGALANEGLARGPWLGIASLSQARELAERIRRLLGLAPLTIAFSGWGAEPDAAARFGVDCVLPLSDHCDFEELISFIKECSPERVYTVHGFVAELAGQLRRMGFDAVPLGPAPAKSSFILE
ncbi:MAG: exonuclease [Nitrososphaerota archaeon]